MVFFGMVNDDVVDIREVDFTAQILHKLTAKLMIDGIDQHILFFTNEIAVIAAAAQRFVFSAVKITYFPVALANPMNIILTRIDITTSIHSTFTKVVLLIAGSVPILHLIDLYEFIISLYF